MELVFSNISLWFYYYITFFVIFIEYLLAVISSALVLGLLIGTFANLYYKR